MDSSLLNTFLDILLAFLLIYNIIPTLLTRFGQVGVISRAQKGEGKIALTFDDGPDPYYTPQVLNILERYQVKACFFVNGIKARAHPELIKQIVLAGHEIGNHGFHHKAAWLLGPIATTREITETNNIIEKLTGQKTRFYRPAWGLFNLFSIWYYWHKGFKVVLWTYMSWDWGKRASAESITRKVLNKIRDGVILILHDSDSNPGASPGGPARVVAALPQILEEIKHRGLQVVPLEEIVFSKSKRPILKKILLLFWGLIDRLIRRLAGIKDLGNGSTSIWRLALRRYRGKEWKMPGGFLLRSGDYYIEIHLNNERLLNLIKENTSIERMALTAMQEVRKGLPELASLMKNDEKFIQAKVLLGITLLHRGAERFGFTVYDLKPGIFCTVAGWYEKMLLVLFHPGGYKNLKSYRNKLSPKYVVMTREELMHRYPPDCTTDTEMPHH